MTAPQRLRACTPADALDLALTFKSKGLGGTFLVLVTVLVGGTIDKGKGGSWGRALLNGMSRGLGT